MWFVISIRGVLQFRRFISLLALRTAQEVVYNEISGSIGINVETCYLYYYRDIDKKEVDILLVKDGALYPAKIKKGISPSRPNKSFKVLEKYNMPVKQGMIIDNAEKIRVLNDNAFVFPVSLRGY